MTSRRRAWAKRGIAVFLLIFIVLTVLDSEEGWSVTESTEVSGNHARILKHVLHVERWAAWYPIGLPGIDRASIVGEAIPGMVDPPMGTLTWQQNGETRRIETASRGPFLGPGARPALQAGERHVPFRFQWRGGRRLEGDAYVVLTDTGKTRLTLTLHGSFEWGAPWYDRVYSRHVPDWAREELRAALRSFEQRCPK